MLSQQTCGRNGYHYTIAHSCTVDSSNSHTVLSVVCDCDLCRSGLHGDW